MRDVYQIGDILSDLLSPLAKQEEFIKRSIIWPIESFRYLSLRRINFVALTSIRLLLLVIIQKFKTIPMFSNNNGCSIDVNGIKFTLLKER